MQDFYKKHTKNTEKPSQEALEQAAREAERKSAEITDSHWPELIVECRRGYRTPLIAEDRKACKISIGKELHELYDRRDDVLLKILKEQSQLHEHGDIYWGYLVQANGLLSRSNNEHTLPASIIYSTDKYYDDQLSILEKIAHGLASSKGSFSDDEIGLFCKKIADDFEQVLRLQLPKAICDGRDVYYATILVQPQHLPNGMLSKRRFPVVTNFNATEVAMILPSQYWPQRLINNWVATS